MPVSWQYLACGPGGTLKDRILKDNIYFERDWKSGKWFKKLYRIHNIELGYIVCSNCLLSGPRHFESMSMPPTVYNPYVFDVEQPAAKPDAPMRSDVPDCNPFPLDTMVRVDVKKQHECLRFVQDFFSLGVTWYPLFLSCWSFFSCSAPIIKGSCFRILKQPSWRPVDCQSTQLSSHRHWSDLFFYFL